MGYFEGSSSDDELRSASPGRSRSLVRETTWTRMDTFCKITVYISTTDSIITAVLGFHSTVICNMITRDHILVLYPQLTFNHIALSNGRLPPGLHHLRAKHNLKIFNVNDRDTPCGDKCPSLRRGKGIPGSYICASIGAAVEAETYVLPAGITWAGPFHCNKHEHEHGTI